MKLHIVASSLILGVLCKGYVAINFDGTDQSECISYFDPECAHDASSLIQSEVKVHSPAFVSATDRSSKPAALTEETIAALAPAHNETSKSHLADEGHGTLGGASEAHEGHGYLVLVFLFGCLTIGVIITMLQKRLIKSVPYTCLLFVAGLLLAVTHHFKPRYHVLTWQSWYMSIEQWQSINPHLLFYVFLPVLIFADAFKMNGHLMKNMLGRILLLAGPGVVLGTLLAGIFTYYLLPYGWDWSFCFLFGSILSATDPVAVVSLFNSLGVSPELTMLVSGESLLNDGTAVVAFGLMLKLVKGESLTVFDGITYFLSMTVIAFILGVVVSAIAVVGICVCCKGDSESDPFIQVVITICCAYTCFIFAEHEVSTSGVLTLVTAGVFMSRSVWPMFVNKHVIEVVWETLEFVANTVIFTLAGLILGGEILSNHNDIATADIGYLFCFYVALTVIRACMVGVFWYPLKKMGSELSLSECTVMVWAGLRGAIGLVLALIVDTDPAIAKQRGSRVIFYVGGMAALTIMINSVTCGPLLNYLGMTAETAMATRKKVHYQTYISKLATELLQGHKIDSDLRFKGVNKQLVQAIMTQEAPKEQYVGPDAGNRYIGFYREMFLEAVKHNYWQDISAEVIPKNSAVAQMLLDSAEECLLYPDKPLADWESVERALSQEIWFPSLATFVRNKWLKVFTDLLETFPSSELVQLQKVYASLCFQEAHRKASQTMKEQNLFQSDQFKEHVMREAEQQIAMADQYLKSVPSDVVATGKAKLLARYLLDSQRSKIESLEHVGMLTGREVEHFTHGFKAIQSSILSDRVPAAMGAMLAKI